MPEDVGERVYDEFKLGPGFSLTKELLQRPQDTRLLAKLVSEARSQFRILRKTWRENLGSMTTPEARDSRCVPFPLGLDFVNNQSL
jgi:hypothetical protein